MSINQIIKTLENLVAIHEDLVSLSREKTKVVKEGSVEKLQSLLVKERKQIRTFEKVEKTRQEAVEAWFFENELPLTDTTITHMLEIISDEDEKQELTAVTTKLTELITTLKQQEQLNESLLNQSMKFVQLSLDMMNPSIKNMNYGNSKQESVTMKRSVFDSKA
ncbi:flagellar protein FlgN [Virgibacillus sp. NKC19-16]|uniref:flagellar protein FlgN n=1 Tax=Virgibacillus salidurans TaxID=2831673 RepID=UPI001F20E6F3|nr:flagellar protein FlgN [Virgibacillus sp. NKC19-16]UJL45345.1 flagellar protein FlgN [Virgibacillus sp. NKC19-16]